MSYILDALRKSEEDRKRSSGEPILQASPPGRSSSKRDYRGLFFWLFAPVVLVLTAGSTYYFLHVASGDSDSSRAEQVKINPLTIPKDPQKEIRELLLDTSADTEEIATTEPRKKAEQEVKAAVPAPEKEKQGEEKRENTETVAQMEPEETEKPIITENKKTPPSPAPREDEVIAEESGEILEPAPITDEDLRPEPKVRKMVVVDEDKFTSIPYLKQLPRSFQETVPKFKLAGHVYSADPERRMILINNSIFREKQPIEKGFFLEMITPDGVVLRDGDTRFRLSTD